MTYGAAFQSAALIGGSDVVLNIGLGASSVVPGRLSVAHHLRLFTRALPELLEPGYIAHMNLVPARVWTGEPLLIVQGRFKDTVNLSTLLWDTLVAAEQDCIAIYYLIPHEGVLFGPRAAEWGAFNINFFNFIGDSNE